MDTEFNALRAAFENLAEINKRLKAHREMMPDVPGSSLWMAWDAEFNRIHKEWDKAHARYREANRAFMTAVSSASLTGIIPFPIPDQPPAERQDE